MVDNNYTFLDEIRQKQGNDALKKAFNSLFWENRQKAIEALNDENLRFPTFYILIAEIISMKIFYNLGARNSIAYFIINEITQPNPNTYYLSYKNEQTHKVLHWILSTGGKEGYINADYYQIIDIACSVLLNTYEDIEILPLVCDMIFAREKAGCYANDLVWAYFGCKDPLALKLVAERLCSDDDRESTFACKLLHLNEESNEAKEENYNRYLNWLNRNDPYLYFTEESNQYSSEPVLVDVDLERKYLHKGVKSYVKEPIGDIDDTEKQCLAAFSELNESEKMVLSDYSDNLYQKDSKGWKEWLKRPINEQVKEASSLSDGAL